MRGTKFPWNHLVEWASAHASLECQELVHSLILELHPELVNELEQYMGVSEFTRLDARMTVEQLQSHIENHYGWALQIDFSNPSSEYFFWYVSQEKEEPRRGERYNEPGSELEMRIGVARDVARLYQALCVASAENQKLFSCRISFGAAAISPHHYKNSFAGGLSIWRDTGQSAWC